MSLTITETGKVLTETLDGFTFPADYSFSTVNDYVHSHDRTYEEMEALCLGMASEHDKLTKQRNELLDVFSLVINELDARVGNRGNAPGHSHNTPGIWDSDNGRLAGKPCAWCAVWNKAKELRASIASVKGGEL